MSKELKFLTNNMEGGILPLTKETIGLLHQKHPPSSDQMKTYLLLLLQSPETSLEPVIFDAIDETMVMTAAH